LQGGELPEAVRRFILEHVESVEQLEILLLLLRRPGEAWSAEGVARELRISELSAGERLEDLNRDGLVVQVQEGVAGHYRYGTRDGPLDEAVRGLASAYAERRVTVINLIFSKPTDKIRTFANAFRFWKGDEHE
jgi:predicted DNA-binding transcriptional regulator